MKAGKYNIRELFVNRYVQQIIIPEIQRDYVWKDKQVLGLLESIHIDYNKFKKATIPSVDTNDFELTKAFEEFYKKRNFSSNIGFIYAYNDEQYSGKYFLIDGQQRITTIYLILLVLATKNQELKKKFTATYLFNENLKLDYKVREASHNFLIDFLKVVLNNFTDIKNQNWYFPNLYDSDTTIKSWLNNFESISNYIESKLNSELIEFYDYLENQIEFWYFDTNISQQGEELYIYMNARGEQMQSNENIKAELLGQLNTLEEKNRYGKLWEDWQDFFWKHRGKNENADKGFNEFLACISGLEKYLSDKETVFYSKEKFDKERSILINDILNSLSIFNIEKYFRNLEYIHLHRLELENKYGYFHWINSLISEFWKILNESRTNWLADYTDNNRATERNRMVLIWSIFYYLSEVDLKVIDSIEVYRFLRKIFIRYKNFNRSVTTIKTHIGITTINGVLDISDNITSDSENQEEGINSFEEKLKNQLLIDYLNKDELYQIESLIWEIEDHKFNIDGSNVGNTNISYLVNFNEKITVDYLTRLLSKFNEVFPKEKKEYKNIQQVLLHYGDYWEVDSPYYYLNLRFDNWRKIIRGNKNGAFHFDDKNNSFQHFFREFMLYEGTLEDFINMKNNGFNLEKDDFTSLREIFLWYNLKLKEKMWQRGNYLAISKGTPCSLPNFEKKDNYFQNIHAIYNSSGSLRSAVSELSNLKN